MRILFFYISLLITGCSVGADSEDTKFRVDENKVDPKDLNSENTKVKIDENKVNPKDYRNDITEIIGTFSGISASDGNWDEGAEEKIKNVANLIPIENGKLAYCYDTQTLIKLEIYGSVYNATIEYIEGNLTVIAKNVNIDGIYTILADKIGQHGKLVIKSQDKVISEVLIQAEGCL